MFLFLHVLCSFFPLPSFPFLSFPILLFLFIHFPFSSLPCTPHLLFLFPLLSCISLHTVPLDLHPSCPRPALDLPRPLKRLPPAEVTSRSRLRPQGRRFFMFASFMWSQGVVKLSMIDLSFLLLAFFFFFTVKRTKLCYKGD